MTKFRTVWFCLGLGLLSGCGEAPPYPKADIASPVGRQGTCIVCTKEIPSVDADNLVTVGGIQFIVCGPDCRSKAASGETHAHAHEHDH